MLVPALALAAQLCAQRIEVVAPRATSTVAQVSLEECGARVLGPWRARVGYAGLSARHREGDGTTPLGTFAIGPVVYGLDPNPGVRLRYHRLRCGDWWDEDARSPGLQLVPPPPVRRRPAVRREQRGALEGEGRLPGARRDRVQHAPRRPRTRLGDLPARRPRARHERLRVAPEAAARGAAPAAAPGRDDLDHAWLRKRRGAPERRHEHETDPAVAGKREREPEQRRRDEDDRGGAPCSPSRPPHPERRAAAAERRQRTARRGSPPRNPLRRRRRRPRGAAARRRARRPRARRAPGSPARRSDDR